MIFFSFLNVIPQSANDPVIKVNIIIIQDSEGSCNYTWHEPENVNPDWPLSQQWLHTLMPSRLSFSTCLKHDVIGGKSWAPILTSALTPYHLSLGQVYLSGARSLQMFAWISHHLFQDRCRGHTHYLLGPSFSYSHKVYLPFTVSEVQVPIFSAPKTEG